MLDVLLFLLFLERKNIHVFLYEYMIYIYICTKEAASKYKGSIQRKHKYKKIRLEEVDLDFIVVWHPLPIFTLLKLLTE